MRTTKKGFHFSSSAHLTLVPTALFSPLFRPLFLFLFLCCLKMDQSQELLTRAEVEDMVAKGTTGVFVAECSVCSCRIWTRNIQKCADCLKYYCTGHYRHASCPETLNDTHFWRPISSSSSSSSSSGPSASSSSSSGASSRRVYSSSSLAPPPSSSSSSISFEKVSNLFCHSSLSFFFSYFFFNNFIGFTSKTN